MGRQHETEAKWEELKKKANTPCQELYKSLINSTFSAQSSSYLT
jgi:hypothetical protein